MEESLKAKILLEALPYIKDFYGRTVVIKYGGHAMIDEELKSSFALNIVLLKYIGVNPVVVHGGGPQIGKMLKQLNIPSHFKEGFRITDDATMDVVEMVLVGKVNKEIVNLVNLKGGKAVGLSGKDGFLIKARKLEMIIDKKNAPPEIIDLGKVGEVVSVNTALINSLQKEGFIPILAPVGVDESGETYNINADYVASAVASSLKATKLILLTDVPGILNENGDVISSLTKRQSIELLDKGIIKGGMIPKVKCCLEALEEGVEKTHIIDGRLENSIILEMFTKAGIGTQIVS
ncbi:N-acetylglutamate kinase [Desulfonauticus submarinus]|uniref:Acetylglutamate kinase n=1 Tax=Desulfonauticus submarinus TaxID=206665 RepID=A0A1H0CR30_9BACT|nr:acetylglutamate kinase [Desulfonauticus submarinus]SDN60285.1 N-acetylglutamate kinase [Desulfonauticus submarinus]